MSSKDIEMPNVDSKPLNGLRGFASFHVLVFHSLLYTTEQEISIYGQVRVSSATSIMSILGPIPTGIFIIPVGIGNYPHL